LLAVIALPPVELPDWPSLYLPDPPTPADRARLAKRLLAEVTPSSVGSDARQRKLGASPLPVDLEKALSSIGYLPSDPDRASRFREEIRKAIEEGEAPALAGAIRSLRELRRALVGERIALGATLADADPYFAEIWRAPEGALVGVVLLSRDGFGRAPIETLVRDSGGNPREAQDKLRRQLLSQALIYQAFAKLFSAKVALSKERRRALPTYVKTLYEPTEVSRLQLLARLKHAKELIGLVDSFAGQIAEAAPSDAKVSTDARAVAQILSGLAKKTGELLQSVDKSRDPQELGRVVKEYDRVVKYLNTIAVHSVNPWLHRQTVDLGTEFEFKKEDVESAVRRQAARHGLDWTEDVKGFEAHPIRGTLGCRALVKLADGTSKVVLLDYDRKRQDWQVRHMGPRLTDVVREALHKRGRVLPDDYDEKYEQPTFRLDEQSCRFLWLKRDVARVEATLILDGAGGENPWRVVYLKYNDDVLVDRSRPST
jgi:hypothetical protein